MKGQNPLISHTLIVVMSVLMLFLIVTTFDNIKKNQVRFLIKNEANVICSTISSQITKIYNNSTYSSSVNQTNGWVKISTEKRLMEYNYKIYFSGSKIFIKSRDIEVNCSVPINAIFEGSSYGGDIKLTWIRLANGTDKIVMSKAFLGRSL